MGRIYKMTPDKKPPAATEVLGKRRAVSIRRKRGRGQKPRVVAGTAAARALGIM